MEEGTVLEGGAEKLALSPQQQAEDIKAREVEFNKKFQALCQEYKFAITVARRDLPNGFIWEPQLMDTKFLPDMARPAQPEPVAEEEKAVEGEGLTPEAEERSAPADQESFDKAVEA